MKCNTKLFYIVLFTLVLSGCGGSSSTPLDTDNDTIIDSQDNCPSVFNTNQLDTDNDSKGNVCDSDDDNDGFNDNDDPAPLDPSIPGDFSTPEAIMQHSLIRKAFEEVENKGFDIPTKQALTPPNLTGYYLLDDSHGTFLATSNNTDVGKSLIGSEIKFLSEPNNHISSTNVFFDNTQPLGYTLEKGSLIRGENNQFTIYSRGKSTCTENGADYKMYFVKVSTAELDTNSGNILNTKNLSVTVATEGNLTTTCANRWAGEGELKGGWTLYTSDLKKRIRDINDFNHMCVDDNNAYIPTEIWTNNSGKSCTCTKEYKVSCQ